MTAHAARHRGSSRPGGTPRARGTGRHGVRSHHRDGAHVLPPPPPADPAELLGVPAGRTAYRLHSGPEGRHRAEARFRRSRAVIGGVAGVAVTAATVKFGAAAAVSSLALSLQHLVR